jgi:predicted nucleic acid-binding protein
VKLLLDLNVLLDVVLDRQPHVVAAAALWARLESGGGRGCVPAHCVTTLYYLVRKSRGSASARASIDALLGIFDVAPVDERVLRRAVALAWTDFEDAVCAAAAELAGCDAIVSRNPGDFVGATVRVMDPATALALTTAPP